MFTEYCVNVAKLCDCVTFFAVITLLFTCAFLHFCFIALTTTTRIDGVLFKSLRCTLHQNPQINAHIFKTFAFLDSVVFEHFFYKRINYSFSLSPPKIFSPFHCKLVFRCFFVPQFPKFLFFNITLNIR